MFFLILIKVYAMAGVVSPTAMGHPLSKKVCEDVISILVSMSLYYFFRHRSRDIRRTGGKKAPLRLVIAYKKTVAIWCQCYKTFYSRKF
jgi:hypothetical protein